MSKYSIDYIDRLRIHELRDFAREVGVQRPTTLKKGELIDKINEAFRNPNPETKKKQPEETKKSESTEKAEDLFASLMSEDDTLLIKFVAQAEARDRESKAKKRMAGYVIENSNNVPSDYSSVFSFKVSQNQADYSEDNNYSIRGGYLQLFSQGHGKLKDRDLISEEDVIYVPAAVVKKEKLRSGMYLTGKIRRLIQDKPEIMYELVSVDEEYPITDCVFEDLPYNPISEEFYFDKHQINIAKGERVYIKSADLDTLVDMCQDLLIENSVKLKFINVKCRPEEKVQHNQKLQAVNCLFSLSPEEVLDAVELTIERVKREVEYGSSTVLVIYNFSELVRIFNVAIQGFYDFSKINTRTISKINNILSLAKFIKYQLHCTVICVDKSGVPADVNSIMELELLPVFNKILDNIN